METLNPLVGKKLLFAAKENQIEGIPHQLIDICGDIYPGKIQLPPNILRTLNHMIPYYDTAQEAHSYIELVTTDLNSENQFILQDLEVVGGKTIRQYTYKVPKEFDVPIIYEANLAIDGNTLLTPEVLNSVGTYGAQFNLVWGPTLNFNIYRADYELPEDSFYQKIELIITPHKFETSEFGVELSTSPRNLYPGSNGGRIKSKLITPEEQSESIRTWYFTRNFITMLELQNSNRSLYVDMGYEALEDYYNNSLMEDFTITLRVTLTPGNSVLLFDSFGVIGGFVQAAIPS